MKVVWLGIAALSLVNAFVGAFRVGVGDSSYVASMAMTVAAFALFRIELLASTSTEQRESPE